MVFKLVSLFWGSVSICVFSLSQEKINGIFLFPHVLKLK